MRSLLLIWSLLLIVATMPAVSCQTTTPESRAVVKHLRALAGSDLDSRRAYIHRVLKGVGLKPVFEEYVHRGKRGKNLVCSFGHRKPAIVLVAHMDRLALSPGANDNASGCAVLLRLCETTGKAASARGRTARKVTVLFSDDGKRGSLGVAEFLRRRASAHLAGALSVDLVGIGDTVLVGPGARFKDNPVLDLALQTAAKTSAKTHPPRVVTHLPASDERAFARRGIPSAWLGLFPADQVDALQAYLQSRGRGGLKVPPALAVSRGSRDSEDHIQAEALLSAAKAVRAFVDAADGASLLPYSVRNELSGDLRRLRHLLMEESGLSSITAEEREQLLAGVGPRALIKLLIDLLEKSGVEAQAGVALVLRLHVGSQAFRKDLEGVLGKNDPALLSAQLVTLYERHHARLRWDQEAKAILLREEADAGAAPKR